MRKKIQLVHTPLRIHTENACVKNTSLFSINVQHHKALGWLKHKTARPTFQKFA